MEDKKNVLPLQRKNSGKSQKAQTQDAGGAAGSNGDGEGGKAKFFCQLGRRDPKAYWEFV